MVLSRAHQNELGCLKPQLAGHCPQSFWFSVSMVRTRIYISIDFSGDAGPAGPGTSFQEPAVVPHYTLESSIKFFFFFLSVHVPPTQINQIQISGTGTQGMARTRMFKASRDILMCIEGNPKPISSKRLSSRATKLPPEVLPSAQFCRIHCYS